MIEWFQEVFSNPAISQKLPEATFETLAMTLGAGFFAAVGGLPLGVTLYATSSTGIRPQRTVNNVVGTIVNIGRSIPFLILVISIIPFTRFVVGTSIGWQAATLPLAIGAIPFYARDRKSTRLNSSHVAISYAVFCLKKKELVAARIV